MVKLFGEVVNPYQLFCDSVGGALARGPGRFPAAIATGSPRGAGGAGLRVESAAPPINAASHRKAGVAAGP